jgi:hypothetical protein
VAVLTDGILYRFYSDIDRSNFIDDKPFLEIDLENFQEPLVDELKRFTKPAFNLTEIIDAATELKYTREAKRILMDEFDKPSEDFVRVFIKRLYSGKVTQSVLEQFSGRVKRACSQFINDRINERLIKAMTPETPDQPIMSIERPEPITDFNQERFELFRQLLERSNKLTNLFTKVSPSNRNYWISAGAGKSGMAFNYVVLKDVARVEVSLHHQEAELNTRRFELLGSKKNEIETAYGEPLEWNLSQGRKQRYIRSTSTIGGLDNKEKWPALQEDLVNRMAKLEVALKEHIRNLP